MRRTVRSLGAKSLATLGVLALAVGLAVGVSTSQASTAQATTTNFNAGYIISDANFFNTNSLSEAGIQAFLVAHETSCQTTATATCLKDFTQSTFDRAEVNSSHCSAYAGAANETAAAIIYKAAQACRISPEVLLVTLEKEESLVSTAGTVGVYRKAMGYGCADTAPACDANYYGFYNQVYSAAWQFRQYTYQPVRQYEIGNVAISYGPGCASSVVDIQNQATANLYSYTPYQPSPQALAGIGGACNSFGNLNFFKIYGNWFGSPTGQIDPFGFLESATAAVGGIAISGWAIDPDSADPLTVDVILDGTEVTSLTANVARADVGAAYPQAGPNHGYAATVPVSTSGTHSVCVSAENVGPGANASLGCLTVSVLAGSPIGSVDSVTANGGTVTGTGWAIDPDTTDPVQVAMTLAGTTTSQLANLSRPDLATAYPAYGANHGYSIAATVADGTYKACFTATNLGSGSDTVLGCSNVVVGNGGATFPDQQRAPIGSFDAATVSGSSISVSGWAIDQDTSSSISVQVSLDGSATAVTANGARPDVLTAYPAYGRYHGFSASLPSTPGTHTVCVAAVNSGAGPASTALGCKSVSIPFPYGQFAQLSRAPIGSFDSAIAGAGTISVSGWSIDPDTSAPVNVQVSVDGTVTPITANVSRADVAAAYPGYGIAHGFVADVAASAGTKHTVCVTALNTSTGPSSASLGCKTVTSPVSPTDQSRAAMGSLDYAIAGSGAISLSGWAIDPDTTSSIQVQATVDGVPTAISANVSRSDVAAAFPGYGALHGFLSDIVVGPGAHTVCVVALNSGGGPAQTALGCNTVGVPAPPSDTGRAPFGSLDSVMSSTGAITIGGWAIDPDTPASIAASITVDGVATSVTANSSRSDVEAAYPGYGESHGFSATIVAASGSAHTVCVSAMNSGTGPASTSLGCRTILVP